jgi:hypothetical protein
MRMPPLLPIDLPVYWKVYAAQDHPITTPEASSGAIA